MCVCFVDSVNSSLCAACFTPLRQMCGINIAAVLIKKLCSPFLFYAVKGSKYKACVIYTRRSSSSA